MGDKEFKNLKHKAKDYSIYLNGAHANFEQKFSADGKSKQETEEIQLHMSRLLLQFAYPSLYNQSPSQAPSV